MNPILLLSFIFGLNLLVFSVHVVSGPNNRLPINLDSYASSVRTNSLGSVFTSPTLAIAGSASKVFDASLSAPKSVKALAVQAGEMYSQNASSLGTKPNTSIKLVNYGGPLLTAPVLYVIWWGASFPSGYVSGVTNFLNGLSCSTNTCTQLSSVLGEYLGGSKPSITIGGSYTDTTSAPPKSSPSNQAVLNEANRAVVTLGNGVMDPNGIYLVYTSNYPTSAKYCGRHGVGSVGGQSFAVGYMPNLAGDKGCSAANLPGYKPSGAGAAVDAVANMTLHEIYEAMTDPHLNAWVDPKGGEMADRCAWKTSTTITAGLRFTVQKAWSNSLLACKK